MDEDGRLADFWTERIVQNERHASIIVDTLNAIYRDDPDPYAHYHWDGPFDISTEHDL
jgi:hypothetical protein